jgi:hypothetical protein
VAYLCEKCGAKGDFEKDFKHKDDCKQTFGSGLKKVCSKSGKPPHVGDAK